ncbi:MAG: O-antigen ligase family protein [Chloroflexota bacterium]
MSGFAKRITKFEWLILALILLPLLFPNGIQGFLLFLIPLLWLIRWVGERHFIPATPLDSTILLMLIMVGVSMIAVFDPALSFPKVVGVIYGIALFYGAVGVTRTNQHVGWPVFLAFLAIGSGMAIVGLIGTHWPPPFTGLSRLGTFLPGPLQVIPGTFGGKVNPNELGGVLSWLIPLPTVLLFGLWRHWTWPVRLLLLLMVTIFGLMLVATVSRGAILGTSISLLIVFAIHHKWGRWLLLIAGLLGMTALLFSEPGAAELADLGGRREIWSRAIYGIADFPFTGMSMSGFRRVVTILYPFFTIAPDQDIAHAHNHLLQTALDLGIPGLIAYLSLWVTCFTLLWQSWRHGGDATTRYFGLGLIGSLAGGWFFGVLDAIAIGARPSFMWWLLLAMSIGVYDAKRSGRRFLPRIQNIMTQ